MNIRFLIQNHDKNMIIFKSLLYDKKVDEAKKFLLDTELAFDELFEYFLIVCSNGEIELVDFIINEFEFNVNDENSRNENILYRLSFYNTNNDVIRYLLDEYFAYITPHNTVYYPLLACMMENFNEDLFYTYLEYSDFNDIKIIDNLNYTLLYNLIPFRNLKAIKTLCETFRMHSNVNTYQKWLHYNDYIGYALRFNAMDIVRYLLTQIEVFDEHIYLSVFGKFIISKRGIFMENPSFNEFNIIFNKLINIIWSHASLKDIRNIYDLSNDYSFNEIYKAINMCILDDYKVDTESVKYFLGLNKLKRTVENLQIIYKYNKKNKKENRIKGYIKMIQQRYRRKHYLLRLKERCLICVDYLIEKRCKKLNCNHIFHDKCIKNWRSINNTCPTCRTKINRPPLHL